jgi:hypothetical protein
LELVVADVAIVERSKKKKTVRKLRRTGGRG